MSKKDWFEAWFDTSYYHSLYQNRNEEEAENFVQNLSDFLNLPTDSKIVDLACGKGRHSITLNKIGYDVLGVDLSENSISIAKEFENEKLKFEIHDMREMLDQNNVQAVFNLFTSFGYFDKLKDNEKVIASVKEMLAKNGWFVIDFMNSQKVINNLVYSENKIVDSIKYNISREYTGTHILKHIRFQDGSKNFDFTEKVQALKLSDFKQLLAKNRFEIIRTFGDFNLNDFDEESSDRLIIIARKK